MAFEDCHSLESITIPKSVTNIDTRAFDDCPKLTSVTCLALSPPKCSWGFDYREPEITLYVPVGCKEKYAAVEPWSKFKEIIEIEVEMEPELTLAATEEDGLVTLRFDAVRNDLRHRIIRVDENGVKAKVESKEGRSYPATIEYVDNPPAGTYTYYAQTAYIDGNGETKSLKSNEVTVTVAEPQTEEQETQEYVSLLGSIEYDKNMPASGVKVKFSDGVTVDVVGTNFMRAKVPVDTDITLTIVGDESHDYEPLNLHIERTQKPVLLRGVYKTDYVASEEANDLATCSEFRLYVEGGQHHAKFTVKNRSNENKWVGLVKVKAVRKNNTAFQIWTDTKPTFYGESEQIEVSANGTKEVDVVLRGMELDKDTEFTFYLESTGKWNREGAYTADATKALVRADGSDFFSIPFVKTVGKTVLTPLKWTKEARQDFACLMLGLSSITPGMEGIVGDFANYQYRNKMVTFAKEFTGQRNEAEAIEALFEWLEGKSPLEAINEFNTFNATSLAFNIITELRNIALPETSIFQKFMKDVIITADDINTATSMMSNVISIVEAVKSKDTFEQVMNCMSVMYSLAAEGNVPLASMMYTYMAAGKTLINAALQLQAIVHDSELPERLKANKPRSEVKQGVHDDDVPSYNTTCDFKIIVQTDGVFGSKVNFKKDKYHKQIKDIRVRASNTNTTTTFLCDRKYLDDGIMLQLMRGTCMEYPWGIKSAISEGGSLGLTKFYIEIHWWNDHVTVIPLNQGSSGVDIKPGDRGPLFDNENMKPSLYTITLTTTTGKDHMADELYLGSNKGRN